MTLYERIKARREELQISQEELAKLLGYKSRSTIAKIESGENDITQSKIVAFAKALRVEPGYLMGWDAPPTSKLPHENRMEPLTPSEESHIKKYRRLDTDGKERIDRQIDFELYEIERNAEKEEKLLG